MRLVLGQTFHLDSEPMLAINIPGIGVLGSCKEENPADKKNPFYIVELDKKILKKLKKEIEKELSL